MKPALEHVEAKTTSTTSTHDELQQEDAQYQRQDHHDDHQMVSNELPTPDQGQCYNPEMNQDVASWWDGMGDFLEYGLWGGLWNLDDPAAYHHHHADLKVVTQNNQGVASYCGGDSNIRAIENQANKAFTYGGAYNNFYLANCQSYSF